MKIRSLFPLSMALVLITFAGGSAFAQTAAPAIAATAITKVPYIIKKPGLYLLKKDVVFTPTIGASGQAITINADDVTLDLGGRVITCSAVQDATNTTRGIGLVSPGDNLPIRTTIRNGSLRNFNHGIYFLHDGAPGRLLVEDMHISNCGLIGIEAKTTSIEIRRCKIVDTGYNQALSATVGIAAAGDGLTRIVDNEISNSEFTTGFLAIGIRTTSGLVERNRIRGHGILGIECGGRSFALENVISGFQTGIQSATTDVKYRGNTTFGAQTPFSGGTAIGTENN